MADGSTKEDIMASKELGFIIDRLMKERERLAQSFAGMEAANADNPEFQFQKVAAKLKLNFDFPRVLVDEMGPKDVFENIKVQPVQADGVDCEWIFEDNADPDARLLYMHGGAFLVGSLDTHRHLYAQIAKATGCAILSVGYRLAPKHPYPAALEDCLHAYLWMLENSPYGAAKAKKAFIAGDSAGGNLTLTTLLKLKQLNKPLPSAAVTLSASTDETRSLDSWVTRVERDPILGDFAPMLRGEAGKKSLYLQGHEPKDPMVSPLFAELNGLPPLLMQAGDAECLRDETEEFAKRAEAAGIDVTLEIWPEMIHVWQAFAPILPEAVEAVNRIGDFVRKHGS